MKKLLLAIFLIAATNVVLAQPIISSFTPVSAKPGDVVTITGSGFNNTVTNNVVFFGATKATINSATITSLSVVLPIGATYAPIKVLWAIIDKPHFGKQNAILQRHLNVL